MSEQEEQIIRKEEREEKHPDTFHVRYYCPKCHSELLWVVEFRDVASAVVNEKWDCPDFEWVTTWVHPYYFDVDDWEYQLEKPFLDTIKNRIAYVYTATDTHYVLLRKVKE